jgi:hypothetical protein
MILVIWAGIGQHPVWLVLVLMEQHLQLDQVMHEELHMEYYHHMEYFHHMDDGLILEQQVLNQQV